MSRKSLMMIRRIVPVISLGAVLIFTGIKPFTKSNNTSFITYNKLTSGDDGNSQIFYSGFLQAVRIFEPKFLAKESENEMQFFFVRMSLIVFISCTTFLGLMLMNVRLTILSLVPVFFSIVCTLGLLIPAVQSLTVFSLILALSLPVFSTLGSFIIVHFYQRQHKKVFDILDRKWISVFIGFAVMTAGFGFLLTTKENLLKGASLLIPVGIGFVMIIAFIILRYLLFRFDIKESGEKCLSENLQDRVIWRYRNMDAYSRFFGFFKIRLDPMFSELPGLLESKTLVKTIIDIGTGYGVPAVWFLEKFPEARIFGLDPEKDRIQVAAMVTKERGTMVVGGAPEVPSPSIPGDLAILLDVIQFIDDDILETTLKRLAEKLRPDGKILLRISVPLEKGNPWTWWLELIRVKARKIITYYRSVSATEEMLQKAGFTIEYTRPSGKNGDMFWILGTIKKEHPQG